IGSVALTKTGAGVLTISGANTFTGNTFVDGGTLKLASAGAVPTNTTVVMSNTPGAALDLNGIDRTIAVLSGGGSAGGDVKLNGASLTVTASSTYGGSISGSGGLVFSGGASTLNNGNSSYIG